MKNRIRTKNSPTINKGIVSPKIISLKKIYLGMCCLILLAGLSACSNEKSNAESTSPSIDPTTILTTPAVPTAPLTPEPTVTPTESSDELTAFYEQLGTEEDGYLFAVDSIGFYPKEDALEQIETYANEYGLKEKEIADCSGNECFAILPKYKDSQIQVQEYTDFEQTQTKDILETSDPVFVLCNPSDLISNVRITVTHQDQSVSFSPFFSLKDGSLVLPKEAYDLTGPADLDAKD